MKSMTESEIILKHLSNCFDQMAESCKVVGSQERAAAYAICAENCRTALTGCYGWQLDLQDELKAINKLP